MNTFRSTFQIKTLTLLMSLAEGKTIEDLRGKKFRLTVPANSLVFDNTGEQSAWFYSLFPVQVGNGETAVPSGITVQDVGRHEYYGDDEGDPRKGIVSRFVYDITFDAAAATFDELPIILKGYVAATNAPATFTLPNFTPAPSPDVEVADIDGAALPLGIGWEEIVGGGSGGGGGHTIQGDGTPFTQRTNLNFTGDGVSVSDDAGNNATVVNVTGGGGGGGGVDEAVLRYRCYRYNN